jgi:large subunit ribosomal protein L21
MFAVIRTGGKQYKVAKDDVIVVERLTAEPGSKIQLDDVLMVGEDGQAPSVGAPLLDGAAVTAEVVEQTRGDKIIVFKKKRRHNYRRTYGHRQDLTVLRITDIVAKGAKKAPAKKPEAKPAPEKTETKAETKAAPEKAEAKAETKATPETESKPKAETKAPAKKTTAKAGATKKAPAKKAPAKKAPAKKASGAKAKDKE